MPATHAQPTTDDKPTPPRQRRRRHLTRAVSRRLARAGVAAGAWLVLAAGPAWADPPPQGPKDLAQVVAGLQAWLMGILAAVATLYLVLAGVYYATAAGDPSQVERAKAALKSALVGYALAVLAPVLLRIVRGIVSG
jgi:hypothetical protein